MSAASRSPVEIRLRMRVRVGDVIAIGPGKIALLEAVRDHGSISAAARSLAMSYRRAWLLLAELNRSLVAPAFATELGGRLGGGARVTANGEMLIAIYRSIETESLRANRAAIAKMLRLLVDHRPPGN